VTTLATLDGKRVVVVGGTSGIGFAIARKAHSQGASVVLAGRDASKAEAQAHELGERAHHMTVDVHEQASIDHFAMKVGQLDHLVLSAGRRSPILATPWSEIAVVFQERYVAAYELGRQLGPRLPSNGSMLLFSAGPADRTRPGTAVLAASLLAVESLARFLALELAPRRVNVLRPGLTDTPLHHDAAGSGPPPSVVAIADSTPVGRIGSPEEVAEGAMFLLTSSFTTGTVLTVNGGHHLIA